MTCTTDTDEAACPQCGFHRTARFSDGKFKKCPGCFLIERRARDRVVAEKRRRARGVAQVKGTEIACGRCGAVFIRGSLKTKYCVPCRSVIALEKANAASLAKRLASGAVFVGTIIPCKHCAEPFAKTGARSCYCPACRILQKKNALPHLREAQRKGAARYAARHPDRIRAYQAESRERRKVNPEFQINERMSAGVRQSLVLGKAGYRWEKIVGYTLADLMRHLERQFLPGMTWENRGEWHIDHIQPLSSFSFESRDDPECRAAWALSNLRPLWALDNIVKNDRRTHLL